MFAAYGQGEAAREIADKLGVPLLKPNGSAKPNGSHSNGHHHETPHPTEAPQVYPWGNDGPRPGGRSTPACLSVRRQCDADQDQDVRRPVRKLVPDFQQWHPDRLAGKKAGSTTPQSLCTAALDPFDPELVADEILWPEGEKDVDTLNKLNLPAFTFGGVGDGLPGWHRVLSKDRRLVILADNDDAAAKHAEKKAALRHEAGAASIKVVHFPELPPKGDVSDFIARGGTAEQLAERIDAAPMWFRRGLHPPPTARMPMSTNSSRREQLIFLQNRWSGSGRGDWRRASTRVLLASRAPANRSSRSPSPPR